MHALTQARAHTRAHTRARQAAADLQGVSALQAAGQDEQPAQGAAGPLLGAMSRPREALFAPHRAQRSLIVTWPRDLKAWQPRHGLGCCATGSCCTGLIALVSSQRSRAAEGDLLLCRDKACRALTPMTWARCAKTHCMCNWVSVIANGRGRSCAIRFTLLHIDVDGVSSDRCCNGGSSDRCWDAVLHCDAITLLYRQIPTQ